MDPTLFEMKLMYVLARGKGHQCSEDTRLAWFPNLIEYGWLKCSLPPYELTAEGYKVLGWEPISDAGFIDLDTLDHTLWKPTLEFDFSILL